MTTLDADAHDPASDRLVIEAIDEGPKFRFVLRLPTWTVPVASRRELLRSVSHFYGGHTPLRAGCPLCHDMQLNPFGPLLLKKGEVPAMTLDEALARLAALAREGARLKDNRSEQAWDVVLLVIGIMLGGALIVWASR